MKTEKQKIGNLGEDLACRFLVSKDFRVIERNYRKKWGEIDVIAVKDGVLHFVEVKAMAALHNNGGHRPEDNVHKWKKLRLSRAIRTYLLDRHVSDETEFEIDVLALVLDFETKKAKIRFVQNVLL